MASSIQDIVLSAFRGGTRYQAEKIAVMGGFLLLSAASLAWAFGGGTKVNGLGAKFGKTTVEQLGQDVFYLMNTSDEDWSSVRLVLNFRYLFKAPTLKSQERRTLTHKDFAYFYYIPRSWGATSWEQLANQEKPGELAPASMEPHMVQLRAAQGALDIDLRSPPQVTAP